MHELLESNRQFIDFSTCYCHRYPGAEVVEMPGLIAAWANTAIPFCNAIFLSQPVTDRQDLEQRAASLAAYLKPKKKPPLFLACLEWIPQPLRTMATILFANIGLAPAITITGMAASELSPPRRSPAGLEFLRVSDVPTRNHLADINAAAYGLPVDALREALACPNIWTDEFAGYLAVSQGKAVAVSAAIMLNGSRHITCVATLPECQRRGYAEAAMRYALDNTPGAGQVTRTTLHATEAGHPVYQRMGYHDTATFTGYTWPQEH